MNHVPDHGRIFEGVPVGLHWPQEGLLQACCFGTAQHEHTAQQLTSRRHFRNPSQKVIPQGEHDADGPLSVVRGRADSLHKRLSHIGGGPEGVELFELVDEKKYISLLFGRELQQPYREPSGGLAQLLNPVPKLFLSLRRFGGRAIS